MAVTLSFEYAAISVRVLYRMFTYFSINDFYRQDTIKESYISIIFVSIQYPHKQSLH